MTITVGHAEPTVQQGTAVQQETAVVAAAHQDPTAHPEQTVVAAISELAPRFRERETLTEAERSVPRESMDELISAGMARMLVPKRYGGLESTVREFVDATAAAAGGSPATGWCASQMAFAGLVVAQYPRAVQDAIWASGPDTIWASTVIGFTATPVDGGYLLSGGGPFASGVLHSDWLYLGAPVHREGLAPEWRFLLVPRHQVEVRDTWQTTAMRGTGSNTVITDNVFVPEAYTLPFPAFREGTGPGAATHPNHLYHLPWVSVVPLIYVATIVGAVQAAYGTAVETLSKKRGPGGARTAESEALQVDMGYASATIDAASTLLHGLADRADSGADYTTKERARATRDSCFVVKLALEAMDLILKSSGTSGFSSESFIQQAWRDVHLAAAHQAINSRFTIARYGMLELGVPETTPPVFY